MPRNSRNVRGARPLYAAIFGLVVALGVPLRGTSWAQPVGFEFQVNTYTTGYQHRPAVTAAAGDGDFVVVWESTQEGSSNGVFGQRYTSAGAAVGAEFQVNTYTTGAQYRPIVAAAADGDFVVVWNSNGQDGSGVGVFGQRYTSAGATVGAEFQVNTYTTGHQQGAAVAAAADGDFVVVWSSQDNDPYGVYDQDGSGAGAFGQRYTSAGAAVGAEFQVNTYTTGEQGGAVVAVDADGDFVVMWGSDQGGDADVFGQRYTSAGAAVGAEFQVNTYTTGQQGSAVVAADADGDFVVVWSSDDGYGFGDFFDQDGSGFGLFGQRYTSAGAAVGAEFQVNTYTTGNQYRQAVTADADGDFVVVWDAYLYPGPDGDQHGVFGQRYTSAGAAVGAEFQVNTYTTSRQYFPAVTADADGDFVVVWASQQDGSNAGIFGQRFLPIDATTTTTTLPPSLPTLSGGANLLLAALLAFAMFVLGFAWRLNSRAG